MNRRNFMKYSSLAGASLLNSNKLQALEPGITSFPNHKPKIKRVIHLYMAGGLSQFESFDNKPLLKKMDGQAIPESLTKGKQLAQLQGNKLMCYGGRFDFARHGQSGLEISDRFPHLSKLADDMCIIRSMHTDQINHDPAHTVMNTGSILNGYPSMGSWVTYALGSQNKDLPGFVVLTSAGGGQSQPISSRQWNNGFLPGRYQGVQFNSTGDAVHYIANPEGISTKQQGSLITRLNRMNKLLKQRYSDPEINTRMSQYDLALRMQASVPTLSDMSNEPKHVMDMYGCKPGDGSFASNCLMARRMAESGVRFIQLYHRGWDHHGGLENGFKTASGLTDQGAAALIQDLKQRGMLDETLIVFAGEFGRTPMSQGGNGRDHHKDCFSMALFGGGIKGGLTYGQSDDFGYAPVENPVHVRDFHATLLHQLGIDHHRLSVKFQGLDIKLTGVHKAKVLKDILA